MAAQIEMDEWRPSHSRRVVSLDDLKPLWRSLDPTAPYGFAWNSGDEPAIITGVYRDYSTVSIMYDGTAYDLAISDDHRWREAMVIGEWMPWPIRSILPRELALEVLLKSGDFARVIADYTWREQEGYDGSQTLEEPEDE